LRCICIAAVFFPVAAFALAVPKLQGPVVDLADLINAQQEAQISASLHRFRSETTHQLQVLTIPSLKGDSIELFSGEVFKSWKLGDAKKDNGVLLLVSKDDRKWRIEVGNGIEGELTDVQAARLGRELMAPAFRRGEYGVGIAAALSGVAEALGGNLQFDGLPQAAHGSRSKGGAAGGIVRIIVLIFMAFFFIRHPWLFLLFLGSGRSSFGGSGFRDGGGWSGGGGGFSGGGASGGW